MKHVAGGLRALLSKGRSGGGGAAEPSSREVERKGSGDSAARVQDQPTLSWQDIRRVSEVRGVWGEIQLAEDGWAELHKLAAAVGSDPGGAEEPLRGGAFVQVFENGVSLAEFLGRIVAQKARRSLSGEDTTDRCREMLASEGVRAASSLVGWLATPSTWGKLAEPSPAIAAFSRFNAPTLLALAIVAAVSGVGESEGLDTGLDAVFKGLGSVAVYAAGLGDLTNGGGLKEL
eukprot:Hpha_TRINITY_DN35406_c0_g1::TRINITY_DN35406_c0_g1_i1::g.83473::m.83473